MMSEEGVLTLEDFEAFVFRSPASVKSPWYFEESFLPLEGDQNLIIQYVGRAFSNISRIAIGKSDEDLVVGLNYLISPWCNGLVGHLLDPSVDESCRLEAIRSIEHVFTDLFAFRCANQRIPISGGSALEDLCFIWWDLFPRHGVPNSRALASTDAAILECLTKGLNVDHLACKEAALHGLGHWHHAYPDEVAEIIDANLDQIPNVLREYARQAAVGDVQ